MSAITIADGSFVCDRFIACCIEGSIGTDVSLVLSVNGPAQRNRRCSCTIKIIYIERYLLLIEIAEEHCTPQQQSKGHTDANNPSGNQSLSRLLFTTPDQSNNVADFTLEP